MKKGKNTANPKAKSQILKASKHREEANACKQAGEKVKRRKVSRAVCLPD